MQKTALSIVYEGVALQLQRNMVIDTLFVNTYTIDLILKHRHPDRLQNFSRYMSSIIQFVAELLLIIPNFVGQLKVKPLHQDTTNITFICPHAHLRIFISKVGSYRERWHKVDIVSTHGLQSAYPRMWEKKSYMTCVVIGDESTFRSAGLFLQREREREVWGGSFETQIVSGTNPSEASKCLGF